ncbi:MAG: hypothetical protein KBS54_04450 [Synergistaceae bacterium]|nr:hypothetical protein [Candidatus Equadaptatus faecalis]
MTITLPDIKMLIKEGAAKEIDTKSQLPKGAKRIVTTRGTYGMTGALWVSKSGKLYALTGSGKIMEFGGY